jgi:hypothetical protein
VLDGGDRVCSPTDRAAHVDEAEEPPLGEPVPLSEAAPVPEPELVPELVLVELVVLELSLGEPVVVLEDVVPLLGEVVGALQEGAVPEVVPDEGVAVEEVVVGEEPEAVGVEPVDVVPLVAAEVPHVALPEVGEVAVVPAPVKEDAGTADWLPVDDPSSRGRTPGTIPAPPAPTRFRALCLRAWADGPAGYGATLGAIEAVA